MGLISMCEGEDEHRPHVSPTGRYSVVIDNETVRLEGTDIEPIDVGDFHGEALDIAFDPDERWLVMGGDGVIVYRLGPPWTHYRRHPPDSQWWEWGRHTVRARTADGNRLGPGEVTGPIAVGEVDHLDGDRFRLTSSGRQADPAHLARWVLHASTPGKVLGPHPPRCLAPLTRAEMEQLSTRRLLAYRSELLGLQHRLDLAGLERWEVELLDPAYLYFQEDPACRVVAADLRAVLADREHVG